MNKYLALLSLLIGLNTAVLAETVTCPDLSMAVQIGTCPSEEELQFTFTGYCSDNARIYQMPEDHVCTDFGIYKSLKNFALWETRDGRFSGYVSCEPGHSGIAADARPISIKLDKQGSVTRLFCRYNTSQVFTYRTKGKCVAETAAQCASDPAACKAECE
jgi:hypothetical protein